MACTVPRPLVGFAEKRAAPPACNNALPLRSSLRSSLGLEAHLPWSRELLEGALSGNSRAHPGCAGPASVGNAER